MKQADLILKLKSLKSIQPDYDVLKTIEKDVYSRFETNESNFILRRIKAFSSNVFLTFKTNPFASYGIAAALLIVVFLSVSTGFLPNEINKTLLYAKIATAPNQYVKASLALSYAQTKLDAVNLKRNIHNQNGIKDISKSIALANIELSELKLMGDHGKYTSTQCKQLYRNYQTSLENLDHYITTSSLNREDKESMASLKIQISNYEKQAEQKLNLY